jgi:lipid II:glycine glycyltransferase (peptidoglycan interpeptide bridge formation enzyme)
MFTKVEEIAKKEARTTFLKSLPHEYLQRLRLHHYTNTPENYTFILPTRNATLDALWRQFKRSPRQGINRAQKKGLTIEEGTEADLMTEYYHIHVETMTRLGAPIRPFPFFETLWNVLAEKGFMKLLLAKYEGTYVAGIIAFPWKETIHLYANASLQEYQRLSSNYILCYAAIKWASQHQFDVDFGLSPLDPNSGPYRFKEQWGGTPKLLFSTSKHYSITPQILRSVWQLRKKFAQRVPENVKKFAKRLAT